MKYTIGVDFGATNIRVGILDKNGKIHQIVKEKTLKNSTKEQLVDQIVRMVKSLSLAQYNPIGIGIGVPGPVLAKEGHVHVITNLGLKDFNLKEMMEARLSIPTYVGNDANVAALAEAKLGAGKGHHVVQFITLSTGLGGGLVVGDELITGHFGFAQEIGNMIIHPRGRRQSSVMNEGCFEAHCSGTALTKIAEEKGLNVAHAGELFELTKTSKKAQDIVNEWIDSLAIGIANMVNYMEPDIFVLGGGVMLSKDYFMPQLMERLDHYLFDFLKGKIVIKPAHFDQDAGIIGAALLPFFG